MMCRLCDEPKSGTGKYPGLCLSHTKGAIATADLKYQRTPNGLLRRIYAQQKRRGKNSERGEPVYTVDYLLDRYLTNRRFLRLHREWAKSGYNKTKRPCIDRINCKKPYSPGNIHLVTVAENVYKSKMEKRSELSRPIMAYKDGVPIKEYRSAYDAARKTGLCRSSIQRCVAGIYRACGGMEWRYVN